VKDYNDTTYAILGILTTECNSGYSIKQFIDRSLNHFWKISYGQIYPTLKFLVDEGLAEVNVSSASGRAARNEYHLTEKGLETLRDWLEQPVEQVPGERNEVLLKLFFGSYQSPEKTNALLQDYKQKLEIRYETYEAIEQGILQHSKGKKDAVYWLLTLDYGKRVTQAAIDWCNEAFEKFSAKGK
jgi:PadR family transcriptional regulator, regulatory protein AphA